MAILLATAGKLNAQHVLVMKNGEKRNGALIEIVNDTVSFYTNFNLAKIPLVQISAIYFNEYVAYDGKVVVTEEEKTIRSGNYTIRYAVKDRTMTKAPVISIGTEDKGVVVVLVEVDRFGNVVSAEPGYMGSTTTNQYLLTKAKLDAQGAKFNAYSIGPLKTKGTITITY